MSSNPFDSDEDQGTASGEILEGFLCPICRADLKSIDVLTDHFARKHAEEEDTLKSVFNIFVKAKKKILNNFEDERNGAAAGSSSSSTAAGASSSANGNGADQRVLSNARSRFNVFNYMSKQQVGAECSHFEYFQSVRNPRLERYASETNKLIIRLHRLLKDLPTDSVQRKQHEQQTVAWLDGTSVKLCPSCAKSFHIARRQHHCRLCGGIMCNDCSKFLALENALQLASLSTSRSEPMQHMHQGDSAIRLCEHCLWLLDTRRDMHESRTCRPLLVQVYEQIRQLQKDVTPDLDMYLKIINSLHEGETIFTIADASALRGKIGQVAEAMDMRSKRILAIYCEPGSREESLKKAIRLSCIQAIKERMLSLPPLPNEAHIQQIQERKRMETEQRILTEQRMAMEAYERYGLGATTIQSGGGLESGTFAQGSDLQSINNWSAPQASTSTSKSSLDDPLIEQINIIKGYIKQARQDMNFEVVETLELNLRELQREVYERQRKSQNSAAASPEVEQQQS
ncbi:rabenosyn-5 [Drosophila guanche]|uniref:Blast:SEC23-interacting protein n=1 Tax=Drosophila guanche TaxID=7266 RepID=A0A3B0JIP7_DROGU|nr:rabenosyn-5 [Drosophila guanche]SPP82247.1 blast:SEC23-interacting protein [Drosophila guanche]